MAPKHWNVNMNSVPADERIYIDTTSTGLPCSVKFKTSRLESWVEVLETNYSTHASPTNDATLDIRSGNLIFKCHSSSGVILIQGPCNSFMNWAFNSFLTLQEQVDQVHTNKFPSPSPNPCHALTLTVVLQSMGSRVTHSVGDGHCLLYSVCQAWEDAGRGNLTPDRLCSLIKSEAGPMYTDFCGIPTEQFDREA